jgi:hypothetical protein
MKVVLLQIPNWMRYPDVDRVEWLNTVILAYVLLGDCFELARPAYSICPR